jgi:hypothetical protein
MPQGCFLQACLPRLSFVRHSWPLWFFAQRHHGCLGVWQPCHYNHGQGSKSLVLEGPVDCGPNGDWHRLIVAKVSTRRRNATSVSEQSVSAGCCWTCVHGRGTKGHCSVISSGSRYKMWRVTHWWRIDPSGAGQGQGNIQQVQSMMCAMSGANSLCAG